MKVLLLLSLVICLANEHHDNTDIAESIARKKEEMNKVKLKVDGDGFVTITKQNGETYKVIAAIAEDVQAWEDAGRPNKTYTDIVPANSREGKNRLAKKMIQTSEEFADRQNMMPTIEESVENAKAFIAELAQMQKTELVANLFSWSDYHSMVHGATAESLIAADISKLYISANLVNDVLSKEQAIELMHLVHKAPLYSDFKSGVEIKEVKAIENFGFEAPLLSDSETFFFLNKKMDIRRHWYKMRGLLRVALRR